MELASADTSAGVSALPVSTPSVITTMARRRAGRALKRRAVSAIASYSDVMPNGSALLNAPSISTGCTRERLLLVQHRIEREQANLVPPVFEVGREVGEHIPREDELRSDPHAAAHVHQDRDRDGAVVVGPEVENRAAFTLVEHFEVCRGQHGDHPASRVADDGADRHDVDGRLENRQRFSGLGRRLESRTHDEDGRENDSAHTSSGFRHHSGHRGTGTRSGQRH